MAGPFCLFTIYCNDFNFLLIYDKNHQSVVVFKLIKKLENKIE
jgi:hypothetical protein